MRFKCYNSDAETCYETARCFTEENKDETECRDIEEIATGLSVTDLEALNLGGLGVLNVFVDFKVFYFFFCKIHFLKARDNRKMARRLF